jgi:phosphoribosylaminoimidazole carboxylase (NCAIR synthetase)
MIATIIVDKAAQASRISSDLNDLREDSKIKEDQEVAHQQDIITIEDKIIEKKEVKEIIREYQILIEMVAQGEAVVHTEDRLEDSREEYVKV